MATLSRFEHFRKSKAGRLILGGAAAGVGAAAGTALGADGPTTPEQVSLGARAKDTGEVGLNLEGKTVNARAETGFLRDRLDSSVAGASTGTGGTAGTTTNAGTGTPGTSTAGSPENGATGTVSPPTADSPNSPPTPDSPDTPDTPDTPDSPDSPDSPGSPDSPQSPQTETGTASAESPD